MHGNVVRSCIRLCLNVTVLLWFRFDFSFRHGVRVVKTGEPSLSEIMTREKKKKKKTLFPF